MDEVMQTQSTPAGPQVSRSTSSAGAPRKNGVPGKPLRILLVAGVRGDPNAPLHSILSEREFQIFCKLAQGESVSEIANRLFLSVKTVSTYRSRILEKMSMKSNADITTYALRNNLVQ